MKKSAIHVYTKYYLSELQSILCFYLQNLATLVKRDYRREMSYLYMAEKKTFFSFPSCSFF